MRVHHVAFRTRDLGRLEAFYVGTLGLVVSRRAGDRSVWLDAGGTIVMLERKEANEPDIPEGSREMIAFAIAPDDPRVARLPIEDRTAFTVYLRDPDGRRVGLSSYPEPLTPSGVTKRVSSS